MNPIFQSDPGQRSCLLGGAIDWTIRDFHGYQTKRGSTYNA